MQNEHLESHTVTPSPLFRSVLERRRERRWHFWGIAVCAVLTLGAVILSGRDAMTLVVTKRGFRLVQRGMTPVEVKGILGAPLTSTRNEQGAECFHYGRPTIDAPSFVLYQACYENGQLVDMTRRQYSAYSVGSDGMPNPQ